MEGEAEEEEKEEGDAEEEEEGQEEHEEDAEEEEEGEFPLVRAEQANADNSSRDSDTRTKALAYKRACSWLKTLFIEEI